MDRDIPVFNRPIMQKILKKNQQLHIKRLKNIRSVINSNNNNNKTIANPVSINNKKAFIIQQQKKTIIQKQNALLFTKMMKIMRRQDPNNNPINNSYSMRSHNNHQKSTLQYSRINQQNRSIFQRLQHQKPTISNKKLRQDRRKNVTLLKFLGKYPNPVALKYMTKTQIRNRFHSINNRQWQNYGQDPQFQMSMRQQQFLKIAQKRSHNNNNNDGNKDQRYSNNRSRNLQTSVGKRRFMSQAINRKPQKSQQSDNDEYQQMLHQAIKIQDDNNKNQSQRNKIHSITLYQNLIKINGLNQEAQIRIIRHYNQYQITVQPIHKNQSKNNKIKSIWFQEIQGNQFFISFDYNFKQIQKLLYIQNNTLFIKNQKIKLKNIQEESFKLDPIKKKKSTQKSVNLDKNSSLKQAGVQMYEQALDEVVQ